MSAIDSLKYWHDGLVSAEHLSGIPNELGSKIKLTYSFGNREVEVIELITKQDFPHQFHLSYTGKGMRNIQKNYFETLGANSTKWVSKNELQPTSFKMSLMLFIMPSAFKKQTKTSLNNFKNFIEKGISVNTFKAN